jgi:hypothetical protein
MFYDDYHFAGVRSRTPGANSPKVGTILCEEVANEIRCGRGRCKDCACINFKTHATKGPNLCECEHLYDRHGNE